MAALFGVGETTLCRWRQRARVEGRREAEPHAGGPPARLDAAALDALRALGAAANGLTLAGYAARLAERTGVRASAPTLCQSLRRLGLGLGREKPLRTKEQTVPTSPSSGRLGAPGWPRSTPTAWSSSTLGGDGAEGIDTRLTGPTPERREGNAHPARRLGAVGGGSPSSAPGRRGKAWWRA